MNENESILIYLIKEKNSHPEIWVGIFVGYNVLLCTMHTILENESSNINDYICLITCICRLAILDFCLFKICPLRIDCHILFSNQWSNLCTILSFCKPAFKFKSITCWIRWECNFTAFFCFNSSYVTFLIIKCDCKDVLYRFTWFCWFCCFFLKLP